MARRSRARYAAPAAACSLGLLAGLAVGWASRPPDLLSEGAPAAEGPPGSWLAPGWASVPRQEDPRQQYRYAQLASEPSRRVEAWIAVSGHFPGSDPEAQEWAFRAEAQLARHYLREGRARELEGLARSLAPAGGPSASDPRRRLAAVARAGAAALRDDADAALARIDEVRRDRSLMPPALIELALEVVDAASRRPWASGMRAEALGRLRDELIEPLRIGP